VCSLLRCVATRPIFRLDPVEDVAGHNAGAGDLRTHLGVGTLGRIFLARQDGHLQHEPKLVAVEHAAQYAQLLPQVRAGLQIPRLSGWPQEGAHGQSYVSSWNATPRQAAVAFPTEPSFFNYNLSPDGRTLASTAYPNGRAVPYEELKHKRITLWETATASKRGELIGGDGLHGGVAFAPDRRTVALLGAKYGAVGGFVHRP
jgi:hypothetical protein